MIFNLTIRCIRSIFDWLKRYYSFRLSCIAMILNLRRLVSDFWWPLSATLGFEKTSSAEFNSWCPILFINIFVFGLLFKILCCISMRLGWHALRVILLFTSFCGTFDAISESTPTSSSSGRYCSTWRSTPLFFTLSLVSPKVSSIW